MSSTVLKQESYAQQIMVLNSKLWEDLFHETLPPLITLDGEDSVSQILIYHLSKNTGLTNFLISPDMQTSIEENFDGISCCFNKEKHQGTYLFWYLDENNKRYALWRSNTELRTDDGKIIIPLNQASLILQLKGKRLIPS